VSDEYQCVACGRSHEGLPLSFAADSPDVYANMNRDERDVRSVRGSDQYIIDQKWFFIRGCLEIPIIGSSDVFLWRLWVSVRQEVFDEISECWELVGREKSRGPFKGRLANSLSIYPETLNLKVQILIRPVGERPILLVEENDHGLAVEQRSGITRKRAWELAALLLHQQRSGLPEAP
jgi:hypothetical protein